MLLAYGYHVTNVDARRKEDWIFKSLSKEGKKIEKTLHIVFFKNL